MLSIYSERIPAELIAMAKAKGVSPKDMDVEIEDNRQAAGDYVKPPEPAYRAYGGEGSSVGAVAPPPSTAIFSSAGARTATPLDAAAPKTTLQVKLANGKRAIIELNLTHTVADLVARVASEGATGGKAFLLKTGYPPKPLDTLTETIEGAGLKNASVLQIIA
jgi:UBX domain-containing protein 1